MSISPRSSAEGEQAVAHAKPEQQVGMLSDKEVTVLNNACVKKINRTNEYISNLIDIAAAISGLAVAYFVGIAAGGFFLGILSFFIVDNGLTSLYSIFKNCDLEDAVEALQSNNFKHHLHRHNLNPSADSLVTIWKQYNSFNKAQAERINQPT